MSRIPCPNPKCKEGFFDPNLLSYLPVQMKFPGGTRNVLILTSTCCDAIISIIPDFLIPEAEKGNFFG